MTPRRWIKFYPRNWLAKTGGLSAVETGVLITLLMAMGAEGHPLKRDDERNARLCGVTVRTFRKAVQALEHQGLISEIDGQFCNRALEVDIPQ